ncbi:MAG: hypothetical protein U0572_18430 [Phycisphaerales bacterium]
MPADTASVSDVVRAVLASKSDDSVVLAIPGTSYRLTFKTSGPIPAQEGKHVKGRIHGKALRMHVAHAGGAFIEPVYGQPRIVQGRVRAIDSAANRVLVDIAVPAWLSVAEGQSASEFAVGQLVNMYVESGMTFTPA